MPNLTLKKKNNKRDSKDKTINNYDRNRKKKLPQKR